MTDKVDTTDTVAIMDDGERSDGSEAPSAHVVDDANANDDDEDTTSIDSAVLDDYVFTDEELKAFPCGWYVPDDLKEGEKVMDRFLGKNKKKRGENVKKAEVGSIVEIPACFWAKDFPEYWKEKEYD